MCASMQQLIVIKILLHDIIAKGKEIETKTIDLGTRDMKIVNEKIGL